LRFFRQGPRRLGGRAGHGPDRDQSARALARFGLDYESVRDHNPGLVYVSISAFGTASQAAELAGYDLLVQAMSGLMSVTGPPDGPPHKVGVALIDHIAALQATVGTLAALHHR